MNGKIRKKIMEMHKKGMTNYAITKQLGLSQTGVKYVLDPKYREHMKQISRKRYSKSISPQLNNTISSSDIAWLSQHRQSVEHRTRQECHRHRDKPRICRIDKEKAYMGL